MEEIRNSYQNDKIIFCKIKQVNHYCNAKMFGDVRDLVVDQSYELEIKSRDWKLRHKPITATSIRIGSAIA